MNLYLATGNAHKVREIADILHALGMMLNVYSAASIGGMPAVEEDADTFAGNARIKARALLPRVYRGDWILADDSGLCVDALAGRPGIHSARYAGVGAGDGANNVKLLGELASVPPERRTAHFHCALVLLNHAGTEWLYEGRCPGRLRVDGLGQGGFGYDPLFIPNGETATFAELPESLKNRISHRARALQAFAAGAWRDTAKP